RLLASKAHTLRNLTRYDEALLVHRSALQTYGGIEQGGAAELRPIAVRALIETVELLCELGRSDEAGRVEAQLVDLLGDVASPPPVNSPARPSDEKLAALLAEVHAGNCWAIFEALPSGSAA